MQNNDLYARLKKDKKLFPTNPLSTKRNFSTMMKKFIKKIIPCLLVLTLPTLEAAKSKKLSKVEKKSSGSKLANPFPGILLKDMTEEQLQKMLPFTKSQGEKEAVFKVFHFLVSNSSDQNNIKNYKIDLADYCFKIKDYDKSAYCYEEFSILYPGSKESEYAQYKAILCWFFLSLDSSRDQTNTQKTITLIDEFLRKAESDKFIQEAQSIRKQCRQKLFEHEIHIFEHYLKRKKHSSAQSRYNYMEENFKDIPDLNLYLDYCKKIQDIVKDPKKCPFLIKFDIKEALQKTTTAATSENKKKTALFFLS